jgi:hypothetical protein
MLQIQRRRELPADTVLEILHHPIEQLRMRTSWSCGPVKIHQLTLDPQKRQQRDHFRGPNPLPRVDQPASQLLGTLDVETLRPRLLYETLQTGYARHRTPRRLLTLPQLVQALVVPGDIRNVLQIYQEQQSRLPCMGEETRDQHLSVPVAATPPPVSVGGGVVVYASAEERADDVRGRRAHRSHPGHYAPGDGAAVVDAATLGRPQVEGALVVVGDAHLTGVHGPLHVGHGLFAEVTLIIHAVLGPQHFELALFALSQRRPLRRLGGTRGEVALDVASGALALKLGQRADLLRNSLIFFRFDT